MKSKIFIDGEHGTTGLKIRERLTARDDLEILSVAHEDRRDNEKRKALLESCDVAILCLPDDASREVAQWADAMGEHGPRIIDTSTAHRSAEDWTFGFPEISKEQTDVIRAATRVSNPGCYSTGAIALIKPLIDKGIMDQEMAISINAVSGYSGGGKQLIAAMEQTGHPDHIDTMFHIYALGLKHKHVPEIMKRSGLDKRPIFMPSVGRFAQGMLVSIPLHLEQLNGGTYQALHSTLVDHYANQPFVTVASLAESASTAHVRPEDYAGRDDMRLWVLGEEDTGHVNLVAQLDNLGKGASGAAVQNLDIMLS